MNTRLRALRRDEGGYALVISMLLIAIMMVSLVVALEAGNAALREADFGVKWARTLAIAESGVDDAILVLSQDRAATSACPIGGAAGCSLDDGEYQTTWSTAADGSVSVTAVGYYPSVAEQEYSRTLQVLLEPAPAFQYALFGQDSIEVKNNLNIDGSIYSAGSVVIRNNTTVCGSVVAAAGSVTMESGVTIAKANVVTGCTGEAADVWAGGSITNDVTTVIEGNAKASAPTGTVCNAASTSYEITSGSVAETATACGRITATAGVSQPGTSTTPPTVDALPSFTFSAANYPGITCYGAVGFSCAEGNTSATAVSSFNTYKAANAASLTGSFAIWQSSPGSGTVVSLEDITLGGDLTVITNAPILFGNTATVGLAAGVSSAELVVISTYIPPPGTSCTTNGGDCSIYFKNTIVFDDGLDTDPSDGIVSLIYTTGKMAVKNQNTGDGALYAGSMDIKNGYDITYNARIAKILGFGSGLEPTLWQELSD
ncbi:MAG: hypothetical protein WD096_04330 [Actinomycetota bacterium]